MTYDLDESVATDCGQRDCAAQIDCGDSYYCPVCDDFFCPAHLVVDGDTPEWTQCCVGCSDDMDNV